MAPFSIILVGEFCVTIYIKLLNICSGDKMLIFNGFVLYFDGC